MVHGLGSERGRETEPETERNRTKGNTAREAERETDI